MNKESSNTTALGNFLRELRESRGYSNVNEYLRKYPLGMSHVHYRHLESGDRKISIESARDLCEALRIDYKEFYYNFLSDWLPGTVMELFGALSGKHGTTEANTSQTAMMRAMERHVLFPNDDACDYLNEHFDLMPILWFIYSVGKTNEQDMATVAKQNKIALSVEKIIQDFEKHGLITTDAKKTGTRIVQRMKPSISFMHNKIGSRIASYETERSLRQYAQRRNPALKDAMLGYGVVTLSDKSRQDLLLSIQNLLREVQRTIENEPLSSDDKPEPVFYSIILAPRKQYWAKPSTEQV